jgi:hypothetical protein
MALFDDLPCIKDWQNENVDAMNAMPASQRHWQREANLKKAPKYFGELKTPFVVDGLFVTQRRMPDGLILARFGPLASPTAAERFLVEMMRKREDSYDGDS